MSPNSIHHTPTFADLKGDKHWVENLDDGTPVLIRPVSPDDREREIEFIRNLSPKSRHFRFLGAVKEISPLLLDTLIQVDYQHRMAFIALTLQDGKLIEIGESRYAGTEEQQCECAVVVSDAWQNRGLGTALMRHLIETARKNGFKQMYSVDAATNTHMHALAHDLGFYCSRDPQNATQVIYRLQL